MKELSEDIILQFKTGDEDAFKKVYDHFFHEIFIFCRHLIGESEAKDMTSEIFFLLWKMRKEWNSIQNIRAYLYITARNRCFTLLRRSKIKSDIENAYKDQLILYSQIESELLASIAEEVEKLPDYYKTILKLSFYQGYKNKEIAERLGVSEKTVRNAKSIGLKIIKDIFNNNLQMGFWIFYYLNKH